MKFQNAFEGVKKIFAAEILSLIGSVCATVMLALSVGALISAANSSATGAAASLGGMAVLVVAVTVLAIIAFIFKLIGVIKASKDEPSFKVVLYLIIAGIVVSVVSGIFSGNATVKGIASILNDLVNLGITVYIIQGIKNLAAKLGDENMVKKGDTIFKYILAIYILVIIAQIVSLILQNTTGLIIVLVIIVISGILNVIQYFLYLGYLSKAKKMLA